MENWLIGIGVLIIALAFVVLVIYLAVALLRLKGTLEATQMLLEETQEKVHQLAPLFTVVEELGEIVEKHTSSLKNVSSCTCDSCCGRQERKMEEKAHVALDFLDWALVGVSIWQKFRERRR